MEFLVHMEVARIDGGAETEKVLRDQEAARTRELAEAGLLVRLWRVPGRRENWGIWSVGDADQLHNALASLPLFQYLKITVHPLASHPNDPRRN
jgi:muconolactone D-isomerase